MACSPDRTGRCAIVWRPGGQRHEPPGASSRHRKSRRRSGVVREQAPRPGDATPRHGRWPASGTSSRASARHRGVAPQAWRATETARVMAGRHAEHRLLAAGRTASGGGNAAGRGGAPSAMQSPAAVTAGRPRQHNDRVHRRVGQDLAQRATARPLGPRLRPALRGVPAAPRARRVHRSITRARAASRAGRTCGRDRGRSAAAASPRPISSSVQRAASARCQSAPRCQAPLR